MPNEKNTNTLVLSLTGRRILWVCLILCLFVSMEFLSGQMNAGPEKAYRLTIQYRNGAFKVLEVKELQMVIPVVVKEQILEGNKNPTGYCFEVLDSDKNAVLRSDMPDPTVTLLEYEDPENPGHLKHQYIEHEEIVFSLIVPATTNSRFVHFTRPATGYKTATPDQQRREELGVFELKEKGGIQ